MVGEAVTSLLECVDWIFDRRVNGNGSWNGAFKSYITR
jgi:hypothetical protein